MLLTPPPVAPPLRLIVPDDFFLDYAVCRDQFRAAASEYMGAGGGEVDIVAAWRRRWIRCLRMRR